MKDQDGLRKQLIEHARARDTIAVENDHEGAACIVIGRVTKVGLGHVLIVGRGHESAIPLSQVSSVDLLEGEGPAQPSAPGPAAVVHGVSEG